MATIKTLTLKDLAEILHMTHRSVQSRLYTHPETLPKPLALPGNRKQLWLEETVHAWLRAHVGQ